MTAPGTTAQAGAGEPQIVLVHGAWHDAACWAPVLVELAARGRDARAVDLPSDRPGATGARYADAVLDAVAPRGRVVLVGHSLGGLTVPVVAQRLGSARVAALVLVAALVPRIGASWRQRAREEGAMVAGFGAGQRRHVDDTTSWPAERAASGLYAGVAEECSAAAVAAAVARLRRQDWTIIRETSPLPAWPAVRTVQVTCADDRVVDVGWSRSAGVVPGAEQVELPGGHFPMLTRPAELAGILDAVAAQGGGSCRGPAGRAGT